MSRFHPLPTSAPEGSRFAGLQDLLYPKVAKGSSSRLAAHRAQMGRGDDAPSPRVAAIVGDSAQGDASKPKASQPASPPPPPAPSASATPTPAPYTPSAPSAAEISARKDLEARQARERAAAAEAEVQKRRAAAAAVWDRAAKANGYQLNDPLPSSKDIAARTDPKMTDEEKRQAAADAVWDRAHAFNDSLRSHIR